MITSPGRTSPDVRGRAARQRRRVRWSTPLQLALVLALVAGAYAWRTLPLLPTDATPAPPVMLAGLDGQVHTLDDFRGRPTVIYFFAPWCRVCGLSADNLRRLSEWRGDSVNVVMIALDWQRRDDVAGFAARHELDVPVLLGSARTARDYRIRGYPTYYVLDAEGRIVRRDFGYSTTAGLLLRTWLAGR